MRRRKEEIVKMGFRGKRLFLTLTSDALLLELWEIRTGTRRNESRGRKKDQVQIKI